MSAMPAFKRLKQGSTSLRPAWATQTVSKKQKEKEEDEAGGVYSGVPVASDTVQVRLQLWGAHASNMPRPQLVVGRLGVGVTNTKENC